MACRAEQLQASLQKYFDQDPRFAIEEHIASGRFAATYRVLFKSDQTSTPHRFVVKRAYDGDDATDNLTKERGILQRLRLNPHIVNLVEFLDNPLQRRLSHDTQDEGGIWSKVICMEYLENGTLRNFVTRARQMNEYLPNRLLWRFLGCLLRAATGLAFSNVYTSSDMEQLGPAGMMPGLLQHNDLHDKNILLGDELPDDEHGVTPVLKWIDFGLAVEIGSGQTGVQGNLYDIGLIMCGLILRREWDGSVLKVPELVLIRDGTNTFHTDAPLWSSITAINKVSAHLDYDIILIVSWLMATNSFNRPTLDLVLNQVLATIQRRDATFYGNRVEEQDAYIQSLWRKTVHAPPPLIAEVIDLCD